MTMTDYLANQAAEWLHYDKAVRTSPSTWDVLDFDGKKAGTIYAVIPAEDEQT